MQEDFSDMLSSYDPPLKHICWRIREIIHEVMPDVSEVVWKQQKIARYGVGPRKMTEHFCYIAPHKDHVNLGVYYGSIFSGPADLMEGTGKLLRHIKIRELVEPENPAVRSLIEAAHQERVETLSKI